MYSLRITIIEKALINVAQFRTKQALNILQQCIILIGKMTFFVSISNACKYHVDRNLFRHDTC